MSFQFPLLYPSVERSAPALSLTTVSMMMEQAESKDKAGRLVQYFARMLMGLVEIAQQNKQYRQYFDPNTLKKWKTNCANTKATISAARRTFRWGKELTNVQAIMIAWRKGGHHLLDCVSKCCLSAYLVCDHVAWLHYVGIIQLRRRFPYKGKPVGQPMTLKEIVRLILRFQLVSFSLQALYRGILYSAVVEEEEIVYQATHPGESRGSFRKLFEDVDDWTDEGTKRKLRKKQALTQMVKYILLFIQALHNSEVYETHDAFIGALGVVSAFIDFSSKWPTQAAWEKKENVVRAQLGKAA